mmetsp:Transcript_20501/g.24427  ORF Transcript_20501/g.24427 Transcript_20501/m.24427 type:complete len:312 (+) Transcript_20501:55-990(+)|eukprot:CAMPEP_0198267656 /NCGR_PEP_ID=MMETSP1447-20131203/33971_1 /TAXON_ID=420782 /ORGANISM="Chaetoceros dichaeta, Strain CCMP1751" /LENGTH=311 /DNA_ID=CAMNT_0043958345 /DNA_START=45 /DNA_END=980 /DNA_ORIENTATION=-
MTTMTTFHASPESELQPNQINECPKITYENNECSTTTSQDEDTSQLESIGETRDDADVGEEENSVPASCKRHISHLEDKIAIMTSELHNRELIAATLLKRIKLMESSSLTAAEASNDGIIVSHEMDVHLTIFNDDIIRTGEIINRFQQIRLLERRLATRTQKLISKNDLIVDLLCHIFMLESGSHENEYEDDIPSNESVVFDDKDGQFILNRKGNENKASQILGMSINVVKKSQKSTKDRNMRKKAILLEAIAELKNESDEESLDESATTKMSVITYDSIDTYAIQEKASRNLFEYIFCSMIESNVNACGY